ncbi:hypothetical protein Cni_G02066 [Canna indica]|uniref:Uncharacterized protein n=1 Tax=Canna indica TaxID=4628 RepID=A0AAQ3Q1W8_9LILI|nr:hypothetical protein Cni_G02066 [Canna indica]
MTTYVTLFRDENNFISIYDEEEKVIADEREADSSSNEASGARSVKNFSATDREEKPAGEVLLLKESTTSTAVAEKTDAAWKPMCDLSYRTDVCDIKGDTRILGKDSSTVTLVSPSGSSTETNESWQVKPYARKWDATAMYNVREVHVKRGHHREAPRCAVTHDVPGIAFASSGYCGNIFYDFADVLLPLFETTRCFNGQVKFLLANNQTWWLYKYRHIFHRLSSYAFVNYDHDDRVHCFKHEAYSLPRNRRGRPASGRGRSHNFSSYLGEDEKVHESERGCARGGGGGIRSGDSGAQIHGGFRVCEDHQLVRRDGGRTRARADQLHIPPHRRHCHPGGAAGEAELIATNYYAEPAKRMKLRYLQYDISEKESTLIDLYPRDHKVFKDPDSLHKEGWRKMGAVYLEKQNVRLDVKRFRPALEKALELLKEKITEHATEYGGDWG